jgi:hypothetical protein
MSSMAVIVRFGRFLLLFGPKASAKDWTYSKRSPSDNVFVKVSFTSDKGKAFDFRWIEKPLPVFSVLSANVRLYLSSSF